MIYLDTSSAAKALIDEDGSAAVRTLFSEGTAFVSSKLLAVELHAVADRRAISQDAAQELLDRVALVSLSDHILDETITMHSRLRTRNALHLATAMTVRTAITGILTFDHELADAAARAGIESIRP